MLEIDGSQELLPCPICKGEGRTAFLIQRFPVAECATCRHRFLGQDLPETHTDDIFDDGYFTDGNEGYSDYLKEADLIVQNGKKYAQLMAKHVPPGSMLDVGAAAGFVMKGFHDAGWECTGLEPNAGMAAEAEQRFGFPVHVGTLEDVSFDRQFDLVNMTQVVAHFYDVRVAFERAANITNANGHWLIETWNHRSVVARLLGQTWHEYCPPSVTQWFSKQSLVKLASQFDMELVDSGFTVKRIQGDHARSLLDHTFRRVGLSFLGYGTRLIPKQMALPYFTGDLFWLLLRKKP
jgi:2-polyprenyl-3-methyl-5-hydroxy-6-metoxy-1,4-benzoquinol methylase